jgi:hypothetical protein
MKLFHQGQFDGRSVRLPVFLGRAPNEPVDPGVSAFYEKLLRTVNSDVFRSGQWSLCERTGWPDNASYQSLVAWNWVKDENRYLIVVNLSDHTAQAQVRVPWPEIGGESLHLVDMLSGASYERAGDEMKGSGLYVVLGPCNYHLFRVSRTRQGVAATAS